MCDRVDPPQPFASFTRHVSQTLFWENKTKEKDKHNQWDRCTLSGSQRSRLEFSQFGRKRLSAPYAPVFNHSLIKTTICNEEDAFYTSSNRMGQASYGLNGVMTEEDGVWRKGSYRTTVLLVKAPAVARR